MELTIRDLKKHYGKRTVLNGISLSATGGECVGILGGNGSGKSTLLSILAGISRADGGGFEAVSGERSARIGYVPQGTPLMEELSAKDNLSLWYDRKTMKRELESGVLRQLGIHEFWKVPVRRMSGGMKKRLSIGCAVAGDPELLLLDEPTAALDIACKSSIYEYLADFRQKGGLILWATHDIAEIQLCDKCFVLRDGQLEKYVYDGDIQKLAKLIQ